jgi:Zn-dependent alcohol dehydrogenase
MSNRAAFLETAKGEFRVRDADLVEPGEGEVLVKVCNVANTAFVLDDKFLTNLQRSTLAPFSRQMRNVQSSR